MLGIVATLNVKPGLEAEFELFAAELAEQVNAHEPGCLSFAVFQGDVPGLYHFVESYVDQAALDTHRVTEHSKRLGGHIVAALLDGPPIVLRMNEIATTDDV